MDIKIKIEYNEFKEDEESILEIRFLRGNTLLHNVFYNIDDLDADEILALKQEAVAKFCSVFPELTFEDIMQGFNASDEKINKMYKETFGN